MIRHCYYLNLDRRPDRREHMERMLRGSAPLKSIYQRVSAVDGSLIHPRYVEDGLLSQNATDDILLETASAWGLSITQGGLGVILSYLKMFRMIQDLDSPAITFEDDVILDTKFDDRLEKVLRELPSDFDICYLGYGEIPVEMKSYSSHLSIPSGRVVCLPGLIVSPKGAKKMLSFFKNLDNQIDTAIAMRFNELSVYVVKDRIVHIPNKMGSDIQGDVNCRKKYTRQNYIFSTLAIGDNSSKCAALLARDMRYFGQQLLVVTDKPSTFIGMDNAIVIYHESPMFSYNSKIACIREGLKVSDAVVCIDADCRLLYRSFKNTASELSLIISPGFHPSWDWGLICRPGNKFFESGDVAGRVAGYGELALEICNDIGIDTTKAFHYQEGIIVVAKEGGKENVFLDTWMKLARALDMHEMKSGSRRIGIGEGNLIGLALVKSGMTINSHDVCNTIGNNVKYNFYGENREKQMRLAPDRKMVISSSLKELASVSTSTRFKDKEVKLELTVSEVDSTTNMAVFKWNQNNAVEFLDHEFSVNGEVFHFQSEKTGEFYFKKSEQLEVQHTFDWYGEKNWVKLL